MSDWPGACALWRHSGPSASTAVNAVKPRTRRHGPRARSRPDVSRTHPLETAKRRHRQHALAERPYPVGPGKRPKPGRRDAPSNRLTVDHARILVEWVAARHAPPAGG